MKKIKKGDKFWCIQDFLSPGGVVIFKKGNVYESLSDYTLCSTVNKDHPIQHLLGDAFKRFFKKDKREPIAINGTNIGGWITTGTTELLRVDSNGNIKDSIVESVIKKFQDRSRVGIKKYGTTLDRNDLDTSAWITHISEELMDALLYLERLKKEI
jgi:hypothetical protein